MMKSRMPTQNPKQNTSAPPSVEALLREKDARIAELMADKANLYQLLAQTQASLAREQSLRSHPPPPPLEFRASAVGLSGRTPRRGCGRCRVLQIPLR